VKLGTAQQTQGGSGAIPCKSGEGRRSDVKALGTVDDVWVCNQ